MNNPPIDIVDSVHVVEVETDTCDTCGAQAWVYAQLPSGRSVAYCAHHGTAYWEQLNRQATVVIDRRHAVNERP